MCENVYLTNFYYNMELGVNQYLHYYYHNFNVVLDQPLKLVKKCPFKMNDFECESKT